MQSKPEDVIGKSFGRLTVVSMDRKKDGNSGKHFVYYYCYCQCGNSTTVFRSNLLRGFTKSCGCFRKEHTTKARTTHGLVRTPEYRIWRHMLERCRNPNAKGYKNYGGRGIKVCPEWANSFPAFLQSVGKRPGPHFSIERTDVNGDYEPNNVKWATILEQARNTRRTRHVISVLSETISLRQYALQLGIKYNDAIYWIKRHAATANDFALHISRTRTCEPVPHSTALTVDC